MSTEDTSNDGSLAAECSEPKQEEAEKVEDDDYLFTVDPSPKKPSRPLTLVPRAEWGATPPRSVERLSHPATTVVFNYNTEVKTCYSQEDCAERMRELQAQYLQDPNNSDILFNFLVGGDGNVYEGRGWDVQSSRTLKPPRYYGKRIDIAWIGANVGIEFIPQEVLRPAYQIIQMGIREGKIKEKYILYENRHKPYLQTYYYDPLYEDPEYVFKF